MRALSAAAQWRLGALLVALAALPLLWPAVPPLIDVPNHESRFSIALLYPSLASFRAWFEIRHVLVGNLGVDLLVGGLAPWLGIEPATKLVILAIPVLSVAGILLIAREVHERIEPLTALAAVFVHNYAFSYGFLNYTLGMALVLLAFGLWLRLGRHERVWLRALLFVPIGFVVWIAHASAWGLLGIMVFAWEAVSARLEGKRWAATVWHAGLNCVPLALPLLPMLLWANGTQAHHPLLFPGYFARKFNVFFMPLRDGIPILDAISTVVLLLIGALPLVRPDLGVDRRLAVAGLVLTITYFLMPPNIIGSAWADMRIVPYALMICLLALKPLAETRFVRGLGLFALLFFAAQILYHTANYALVARAQERQLEALDHLPEGTTVFGLVGARCEGVVAGSRVNHLQRMAIVRRHAFTNGSWGFPATQTILARPEMTKGYDDDGSQLIEAAGCIQRPSHTIEGALQTLPRERFRYLWLIDLPPERWPVRPWLHPVWHNERGALYQVDPPIAG